MFHFDKSWVYFVLIKVRMDRERRGFYSSFLRNITAIFGSIMPMIAFFKLLLNNLDPLCLFCLLPGVNHLFLFRLLTFIFLWSCSAVWGWSILCWWLSHFVDFCEKLFGRFLKSTASVFESIYSCLWCVAKFLFFSRYWLRLNDGFDMDLILCLILYAY